MIADLISTLRMLVEINLFALLGQGVLYLLPGVDRQTNIFYLIIRTIASPAMRFARWVTPKFVLDRHIGFVAVFIAALLWVALAVLKQIAIAMDAG